MGGEGFLDIQEREDRLVRMGHRDHLVNLVKAVEIPSGLKVNLVFKVLMEDKVLKDQEDQWAQKVTEECQAYK